MPISNTALAVLVLGAALSAGLSAVAAWSSRRKEALGEFAPWWGALAVGLGFVVAQIGVATPVWPLLDVTDRTPIVAVVAALAASTLAWSRGGVRIRIPAFLGLAVLAYLTIVGPVLGADGSEETVFTLSIVAGSTILAMVNLGGLDAGARRRELSMALVVVAGGAGVVFILSNSLVLLLLAGSLAVVLASSLVGGWGRPVGGGVPVASTVLSALILNGLVYGSVHPIPASLIAAAPVMLWVLRIGPLSRFSSTTRAGIAVGLVAIPVIVAMFLAWLWRSTDGYV